MDGQVWSDGVPDWAVWQAWCEASDTDTLAAIRARAVQIANDAREEVHD